MLVPILLSDDTPEAHAIFNSVSHRLPRGAPIKGLQCSSHESGSTEGHSRDRLWTRGQFHLCNEKALGKSKVFGGMWRILLAAPRSRRYNPKGGRPNWGTYPRQVTARLLYCSTPIEGGTPQWAIVSVLPLHLAIGACQPWNRTAGPSKYPSILSMGAILKEAHSEQFFSNHWRMLSASWRLHLRAVGTKKHLGPFSSSPAPLRRTPKMSK